MDSEPRMGHLNFWRSLRLPAVWHLAFLSSLGRWVMILWARLETESTSHFDGDFWEGLLMFIGYTGISHYNYRYHR